MIHDGVEMGEALKERGIKCGRGIMDVLGNVKHTMLNTSTLKLWIAFVLDWRHTAFGKH